MNIDLSNTWVWDIETYPNVFTLAISNAEETKTKVFEVSEYRDDRDQLFEFLRSLVKTNAWMVGYNNIGFDYPVLHWFLKNQKATVIEIYHKAMGLISSGFDNRFAGRVKDDEVFIKQIDLFLLNHFDNKAKMTSLKQLEFVMELDDVSDLPFEVGKSLTPDEISILKRYNAHDVKATKSFLMKNVNAINFRLNTIGVKGVNYNDTKIGKQRFIDELEKANKGTCYSQVGGRRVMNQTIRDSINLGECILPYVKFERPELKAVLEWFKAKTITETKGSLTDILESDLGDVAKYAVLRKKRQRLLVKPSDSKLKELQLKHPMGWLSEEPLKSGKVSYYWNWNVADALNVEIDGLQYVFGTGGIHAARSGCYEKSDNLKIKTVDVSSYYPNLSIKNNLYPDHLGSVFCEIYQDLYEQRKKTKKASDENLALKLALNGTYGASNDQYSPMYDPKFTMSITINGQLLLCVLAEKLMTVDGVQILMMNTDGLEYSVSPENESVTVSICEQWEKITQLTLEYAAYSKLVIYDVNSYIGVFDGDESKVKTKGRFAYEGLGWHQNHSFLIIPEAAVRFIVDGTPIEQTIRNETHTHKFMGCAKVPRSSKLVMVGDDGSEDKLPNICRYYASTSGGNLVKVMPPLSKPDIWFVYEKDGDVVEIQKKDIAKYEKKGYTLQSEINKPRSERRIGINAGQMVKVCNKIIDFDNSVDYDWYVREATKLAAFEFNDEEVDDETREC